MYKYNYSLTEIENMMPWEKEIYTILLKQEKEAEKTKAMNNG